MPFHQHYLILGKLGKGAFASVYLVREVNATAVEKHVVKVIDLRGATKDGTQSLEVSARMKRAAEKEANFLRKVSEQKHCIRLLHAVTEDHFSYIVMERCELTLLRMLERVPNLTEATYVSVFHEMFLALANIHALRIVHRDIKPDNFLCAGPDATIKLCDFGLAEVEPSAGGVLSGVYGTAPFMSPEMLSSQGYGTKADVWSLGVIMYVLMFGQFPYIPAKSSANAMKAAILLGNPPPSFRPKPSLDLFDVSPVSQCGKELLRNLLARDTNERFTASDTLAHSWFSPDEERGSMPLRPMLYAAKRVGAFDLGSPTVDDSVDVQLKQLQEKYHGAGRQQQQQPQLAQNTPLQERYSHSKEALIKQGVSHDSTATETSAKQSETPSLGVGSVLSDDQGPGSEPHSARLRAL